MADTIEILLRQRGISRRSFLGYCSYMAGLLALQQVPFAQRIAHALGAATRLPVVWLNGQDCNGNIESFLRAEQPTVSELILDRLSIDYLELLMAPAGASAERSRADAIAAYHGRYVVVVEGGIPTARKGTFCCIGGRSFASIVREVCGGALATIAVGSCAFDGGLPAAKGGVTRSVGVKKFLGPNATVIALPGCPMNVENLTATIVHYLSLGSWPETDHRGRPYFAYGEEIHEQCERQEHFEEGRYVRAWGDQGHRLGWCLRFMGCQGPETRGNCPSVRWNGHCSWPVAAGAPCLGCSNPRFWDVPGGFYAHRPGED